MTANAFMSVSLEPPLVLISVDRRTQDVRDCSTRAACTASASCARARARCRTGSPAVEAARAAGGEPRFDLVHDTPLVEGALAGFVSKVVRSYWGGDHSLFLGRVEYAHTGEGAPLLFHGGRYERLGSGNGA